MGNTLTAPSLASQAHDLPTLLLDIPQFLHHAVLGGGKLFKTVQCLFEDGFVVVKVHVRRGERDFDSTLRRFEARLAELHAKLPLSVAPSLLHLNKIEVTERAVYLGRQYLGLSLVDRFHVHPSLATIEKQWLTFQMLHAVAQMHASGIRHGDIKTENFVLTSWLWLFLVDLAFYKPTFLPADNPADYHFYFETSGSMVMGSNGLVRTSGRRRCYIAPERFYSAITERKFVEPMVGVGGGGSDGQVSEAMDVFSLGCVIAELFLNGENVLFDLPALLAYRDGSFDPTPIIHKIPYAEVRTLVTHMIQRDPTKRFAAKKYMQIWSKVGAGGPMELVVPPLVGDIHAHTHTHTHAHGHTHAHAHQFSQTAQTPTSTSTSTFGNTPPTPTPLSPAPHGSSPSPSLAPLSTTALPSSPPPSSSSTLSPTSPQPNASLTSPPAATTTTAASTSALFPPYFPYLYRFVAKLSVEPELADPDIKIQALKTHQHTIIREVLGVHANSGEMEAANAAIQAIHHAQQQMQQQQQQQDSQRHSRTSASSSFDHPAPPTGEALLNELSSFQHELESKVSGSRSMEELQAEAVAQEEAKRKAQAAREEEEMLAASRARSMGTTMKNGPTIMSAPVRPTAPSASPPLSAVAAPTPSAASMRELAATATNEQAQSTPSGSSNNESMKLDEFSLDKREVNTTPSTTTATPTPPAYHGNGLTMITSLVCSCIQNVRYPITKLTALELLIEFGAYVDDEVRLGRLVPYAVALLSDPSSMVRATACHVLTQLLSLIRSIRSDAPLEFMFGDYIFPSLSRFPHDSEEIVRLAYAQCIAPLAAASQRFLNMARMKKLDKLRMQQQQQQQQHQQQNVETEASSTTSVTSGTTSPSPSSASVSTSTSIPPSTSASIAAIDAAYETSLSALQDTIVKLVIDLLTGGGSRVKRALLADISSLCSLMGRSRVNNDLLPHLITVLNDRDWHLRSAFFEYVVGVAVFVGRVAFRDFVLPCIETALVDGEEFVIQRAVHALTTLSHVGLFEKRVLVDISKLVGPLLCHPSAWIRHESVKFMASVAAVLGPAAAHVFLAPILRPYVRAAAIEGNHGMIEMRAERLAQILKPHLTREEFRAAVQPVPTGKSSSAAGEETTNKVGRAIPSTPTSSGHTPGIAESFMQPRRLMESAAAAGTSWSDSSSNALSNNQHTPPPRSMPTSKPPPPGTQLSRHMHTLPEVDDDQSNLASTNTSEEGIGTYMTASSHSSGYRDDPALRQVMESYLMRASQTIQRKTMQSPSSASSAAMSRANAAAAIAAGGIANALDPSSQQRATSSSSTAAAAAAAAVSSLAQMDDESLSMELENLSMSSTMQLEEQIPLHQLEIERTMQEQLVVGPHGTSGGNTNAASGHADGSDGSANNNNTSMDPSRRPGMGVGVAGSGGLSRSLSDPSMLPPQSRLVPPGAAAATTAGATAQGGHPVALKENLASVPDYIRRALGVPLPPPSLGHLRTEWTSYAPFFANRPLLDPSGYNYAESCDPKLWRPKGVLVATLSEHRQAVTSLAVSRDNLFLASGGADGIVRIWDSQRLKLTAHARSQLSYVQGGRITSLTVCDSSHAVAAASSNGSLHVFKVEYASDTNVNADGSGSSGGASGPAPLQRYIGLSDVKRIDPSPVNTGGEGCMLAVEHFNTLTESLLVYATQKCVHGWDLRSKREAFELPLEPSMGLISSLSLGPSQHCLVTGTDRGFICVWDLRFQIPVQVWRHSAKNRIVTLSTVDAPSVMPKEGQGHGFSFGGGNSGGGGSGASSDPHSIVSSFQHPTKGPLIFAAAEGTNQIAAFDIYTGESRMLLRVHTPTSSSALARKGTVVVGNSSVSMGGSGSGSGGSNTSSGGTAAVVRNVTGGSRNRVRVSPLSLPSLRSYMRHDSHAVASGSASGSGLFSPPHSYTSSSGFYHSILGVTLDDAFVRELSNMGLPPDASTQGGPADGMPSSSHSPSTAASKAPTITSMLLCKESFALTAGTDAVVRFWDLRDPADSYRICGEDLSEGDYLRYHCRVENSTVVLEEVLSQASLATSASATSPSTSTSSNNHASAAASATESPASSTSNNAQPSSTASIRSQSPSDRRLMEEKLRERARRQHGLIPPSASHTSAILAMKAFEYPQKMLATASRDGSIKIWI